MARHKPKFGYRPRHPLSRDGITVYSDKDIEALVQEHGNLTCAPKTGPG